MGVGMGFFQVASVALGTGLAVVLLWSAWVSGEEGEPEAAKRLAVAAGLVFVLFLLPLLLWGVIGVALGLILILLSVGAAVAVLLPRDGEDLLELGRPVPGVDERDIMFSRATLVPGTERFEAYYRSRPENRKPDDKFRDEPGLLSPGTAHFHRQGFAAADAAFWTIEMLRPFVEGDLGSVLGEGGSPNVPPGSRGEAPGPTAKRPP